MRHRNSGKQLSRNGAHRKALRRNMAASLIEHGAIRTTVVKAKELRPFIERLITVARKNTLTARRRVISLLQDRYIADDEKDFADWTTVVTKLFSEVAPRYVDRPGGYTRIIRLSERRIGDAGKQVVLQLVEESKAATGEQTPGTASRRRRRASKRQEALTAAGAKTDSAPAQQAGEQKEEKAE